MICRHIASLSVQWVERNIANFQTIPHVVTHISTKKHLESANLRLRSVKQSIRGHPKNKKNHILDSNGVPEQLQNLINCSGTRYNFRIILKIISMQTYPGNNRFFTCSVVWTNVLNGIAWTTLISEKQYHKNQQWGQTMSHVWVSCSMTFWCCCRYTERFFPHHSWRLRPERVLILWRLLHMLRHFNPLPPFFQVSGKFV